MGSHRQPSAGTVVVAVLALVQAALGVLRALEWVRVGSDLVGRGLVLIPIVGAVAIGRGVVIGVIALLYALFALGALRGREWARWTGFGASLLTVLLVGAVLLAGDAVRGAVLWLVVPAIIVAHELFRSRHGTVTGSR